MVYVRIKNSDITNFIPKKHRPSGVRTLTFWLSVFDLKAANLNFTLMSEHFFIPPCKSSDDSKPFMPTLLRVVKSHEDGSSSFETIVLEQELNPLHGLSYDDFSVTALLKAGVPLKSLSIQPDLRLGFDAEIDSFNSHLEEISSELFIPLSK